MQLLRQVNNMLMKIASVGIIITMATIAIVIPYEVFGRYVLSKMSIWTNELSQYSLVWATMLGGAVGLRKGLQVGITTLTDNVSPGTARIVRLIGYVFMLIFLTLMVISGVDQTLMNIPQLSSTIGISMSIPYAAMPVGFFLMLLVTLEQFLEFLGIGKTGGK